MSTLLGVVDGRITSKYSTSWQTNKIGGKPDCYSNKSVKEPACKLCSNISSLIVQLYCPLEGSCYHRTLYMFACIQPSCWNKSESWSVYRLQCKDQEHEKITEAKSVDDTAAGCDDWGVDANDWGVAADDWGVDAESWNNATDSSSDNERNINCICNEGICETDISDIKSEHADCMLCKKNLKTKESVNNDDSMYQPDGFERKKCNIIENGSAEINIAGSESQTASEVTSEELSLQNLYLKGNDDDDSDFKNSSDVIAEDILEASTEQKIEMLRTLQTKELYANRYSQDAVLIEYFVSVIEEPVITVFDDEHVVSLLEKYQAQEGHNLKDISNSESSGSGEKYEKPSICHGDLVFHKFLKRLSFCPGQCIRYHWHSTPLLIHLQTDDCVPRTCAHCGARIVFELQIMPPLINFLKLHNSDNVPVEFGTVLIYTCEKSCWQETDLFRTENVVVQSDPDQYLFDQRLKSSR